MLNNREIAAIFWLIVFCIFVGRNSDVRGGAWGILNKLFSTWKLLFCLACMVFYVVIVVTLLSRCGIWDQNLLKDTVVWTLFSGVGLIFSWSVHSDIETPFSAVVKDCLKIAVVVEFVIVTYVFPLIVELILVPLASLLFVMEAVSSLDSKHADVRKLLNSLIGFMGVIVLFFALRAAILDWTSFYSLSTLKSVLLAPVLTLAFIPFLYGIMLINAYETLMFRLNFAVHESKELREYLKEKIFFKCGLSLSKLMKVSKFAYKFKEVQKCEEVDNLLQRICANQVQYPDWEYKSATEEN